MKTYGNIVTRYDNMIYDSRPASFNEFISDKYNIVHNELYNNALNKYFDNLGNIYINSDFLYEMFKTMENNSDTFDDFWKEYNIKDNARYIKSIMSKISIDDKCFLQIIFSKIVEFLELIQYEVFEGEKSPILENNPYLQDFRRILLENLEFLDSEENNDPDVLIGFESELDINSYLVLLEDEYGTRIAYDRRGNWHIWVDGDRFTSTEKKIYIIRFIRYLNKELRTFISCMLTNEYKEMHKIIEIKNDEYWQPSSIIALSKVRPYKKDVIDLTPYWNDSQAYADINVSDVNIFKDKINDAKVTEINYITGKVKLYSKSMDANYEVPFKYLDSNIEVDDELKLDNTFTYKYNEIQG